MCETQYENLSLYAKKRLSRSSLSGRAWMRIATVTLLGVGDDGYRLIAPVLHLHRRPCLLCFEAHGQVRTPYLAQCIDFAFTQLKDQHGPFVA